MTRRGSFPPAAVAGRVAGQAAAIWVAARLLISMAAALVGVSWTTMTVVSSARASIILVAAVVAVCGLRWRARGEHLFLANLGVSEVNLPLLAAAPPVTGEIVVGIVALALG